MEHGRERKGRGGKGTGRKERLPSFLPPFFSYPISSFH